MPKVPTVTIWDPRCGRTVINRSDYDPDAHELYNEEERAPRPAPPPTVDLGSSPKLRVVNTSPGWWKVLDDEDEQVGAAHKSEAAANRALRELVADG